MILLDSVRLAVNTTYDLRFIIENGIADDPDEIDIAAEIAEEDDEHQIFFEFTDNAFASPTGNGNIDQFDDPLNYQDEDENMRPVGLETQWETPLTGTTNGLFRVLLKHQPNLKADDSTAQDGEDDFDLPFVLIIE